MDGTAELASNLKAEILDLKEDLRMGAITDGEAYRRLKTIRRRRMMGVIMQSHSAAQAGVLQVQQSRESV